MSLKPVHRIIGNSRVSSRRGGFTFVEVLFAVILLGIGFIMIAGVFPVSIQQSAVSIDETTGATVARGALDLIQKAVDSGMPMDPTYASSVTLQFWPLQLSQWNFLGSQSFFYPGEVANVANRFSASINTQDPRYSWIAYYCRATNTGKVDGTPYPYARVIVIALKNPNFINYEYQPPVLAASNVATAGGAYTSVVGKIAPFKANIALDSTTGNYTITLTGILNPSEVAAPGAFVVVQGPPLLGPIPLGYPPTGRVYRLGALLPANATYPANTYQLQPGIDPTANELAPATAVNGVLVYIVGRAPTHGTAIDGGPEDFTGPFTGPNQDIAVVSGFVRVTNRDAQ